MINTRELTEASDEEGTSWTGSHGPAAHIHSSVDNSGSASRVSGLSFTKQWQQERLETRKIICLFVCLLVYLETGSRVTQATLEHSLW